MIYIYFAGSIRGGRQLRQKYQELIIFLRKFGYVFTEHVGDDEAISKDKIKLSDREIHDRDMDWIIKSDLMIAEVSVPSLGVGYEIATAITMRKRVLCLYDEKAEHQLSAMIAGCQEVSLLRYNSPEQLKSAITQFIKEQV